MNVTRVDDKDVKTDTGQVVGGSLGGRGGRGGGVLVNHAAKGGQSFFPILCELNHVKQKRILLPSNQV